MHEMSIAKSILKTVRHEIAQRPGADARKLGIRVGKMTAIDAEALRFAFEVLAKQNGFPGLVLEIETCPLRHRCESCRDVFEVIDYDLHCPRCGKPTSLCPGADELELAYLEVEQHEPSTA
ncbi:MAG TPA: hydrogenase maturation nickel metallochaperone HypA [Terriglobales bacterium]|nr:hydrogenase maturation nickel metallochaperone HypA [Terriglobales bacterium]